VAAPPALLLLPGRRLDSRRLLAADSQPMCTSPHVCGSSGLPQWRHSCERAAATAECSTPLASAYCVCVCVCGVGGCCAVLCAVCSAHIVAECSMGCAAHAHATRCTSNSATRHHSCCPPARLFRAAMAQKPSAPPAVTAVPGVWRAEAAISTPAARPGRGNSPGQSLADRWTPFWLPSAAFWAPWRAWWR
jgi:hypothetical protein